MLEQQSAGVTDAETLLRKYKALCVEIGRGDSHHLERIERAVLALAPGLSGWVSVAERMPDTDAEVLVWTPQGAMLDRWRMQSEAPLSFSSATVETGMYWDEHEFEDVSHWQPITAPGIAPHQPQPDFKRPHWTAEETADGNRGIRWVMDDGVYGRPSEEDVQEYLRNRWLTQPQPEGDGWISVKDRLPTHNYSVLGVVVDGPFVVDDGSDDRMRDVVSYEPSRGWLQHDGNDSVVVTVTHWQDLPDLP